MSDAFMSPDYSHENRLSMRWYPQIRSHVLRMQDCFICHVSLPAVLPPTTLAVDAIQESKKVCTVVFVKYLLMGKTGARALRAIMENIMLDIMFNLPQLQNVRKVIITEDNVKNKTEPLLIYHEIKKTA